MFNFTSRYSSAISIILLAISVLISIYFYRKSSVSKTKKILLTALKSLAIFLVLVLLIEPSILAVIKINKQPLNIIMVDNSRSNELPGQDSSQKKNNIIKILEKSDFNNSTNKYYTFSSGYFSLTNKDSTDFNGYKTDLSSSLEILKSNLPDEQINSLTVISDGNFNAGGNPLYKTKLFQCPVLTIGIGDTLQKKDILIQNVIYINKSFTESNNKITAIVNAYNSRNESVTISLLREGTVISSKQADINNDNWSGEIEFEVKEPNPGIVHYTIKAENRQNEITYKNNYSDFLIEYIGNKVSILFISGGPGYDNALFTNILKRINNYIITIRTSKNPSEFYEGGIDSKSFPELSAIFLLNYPVSQTSSDVISNLSSKAKEFNVPLIFFAGKNTDYNKLRSFEEQLPFTITGSANESEFTPLVVSVKDNPFTDIAGEISSSPQIFRNVSGITQKSGTEVLMTDRALGLPVAISRNTEKNKSSAFLGYGLWRWQTNSSSDREKTVEKLILETINLTLQKEKRTKLRVYPAKNIFDYTESPVIYAEVYDDNFQLTRNASVRGKIYSKDKSIAKDFQFIINENKYSADLPTLPAGDYIIEAEAELNNNFYANAESRFLSDTLNLEYLVTKSNFNALKELSQNSDGKFTQFNNNLSLSELLEDVKNPNAQPEGTKSESFNLWENKYVLLLIILLFTIEWVIRKRNNIA